MSRYNKKNNSYSADFKSGNDNNNYNNDNSNDSGSSSSPSLEVKYNSSGYRQYKSESTQGKWNYTHRTVAEKKVGRKLQSDEHAHHINKNKTDNRPQNIVVLKENIHRQIHKSDYNEKNGCFSCGRNSHWAQDCYAKTDIDGNEI